MLFVLLSQTKNRFQYGVQNNVRCYHRTWGQSSVPCWNYHQKSYLWKQVCHSISINVYMCELGVWLHRMLTIIVRIPPPGGSGDQFLQYFAVFCKKMHSNISVRVHDIFLFSTLQILERGLLRSDSRTTRWQSNGYRPHWRHVRRQHKTLPFPLPRPQNATNPTGERHCRWVHKERGL